MGFIDSSELHFPPGSGPFHVKGTVYLGLLDHYGKALPGGIDSVLAQFGDDFVLKEFFRQQFLAGSWYDVGPSVLLSRAAAVASGVPHLELLRKQARAQAERDIHGVYRLILRLAKPEMIMARLPTVASRYFDFVRAEVREIEPRRWESTARGIPAMAQHSYMAGTEAFVVKALETAGAKELRHRWQQPEPEGEVQGVPVVCLRREVSWK